MTKTIEQLTARGARSSALRPCGPSPRSPIFPLHLSLLPLPLEGKMRAPYQRKTSPVQRVTRQLLLIDWPRLLLDLRGEGIPVARIARMAECSREHIYNLEAKAAAQPSWRTGELLLALWKQVTGHQLPPLTID